MVAEGLAGEARALYDSPFREALRASRVVGYTEFIRHFENEVTLAETIA